MDGVAIVFLLVRLMQMLLTVTPKGCSWRSVLLISNPFFHKIFIDYAFIMPRHPSRVQLLL